jgi:glycosyltransferase involved in cell wall biosynthesis
VNDLGRVADRIRGLVALPFYRQLVRASGLFDAEWYRLAHPVVMRDGVGPLDHFLRHGAPHRLSPGPNFDSARYLDEHQDARNSGLNPLVHYLIYGRARGLIIHKAPPSDADRIRASGLFDAEWYLSHNADVAAAGLPPFLHFMASGALEGRSPGPDFDANWYLRRYADVVGLNPVLHYIDRGSAEGRLPVAPQRNVASAQRTVADLEDLEPELYGADYFADIPQLEIVDSQLDTRLTRAFDVLVARTPVPPRFIVCLPWLTHGGADLVAGHAIRAIAEAHGARSLLVVLTDHDRLEAAHLLPPDVPILSFAEIDPRCSLTERAELVDLLVRGFRPDAVLNVNSHAGWEAMLRYGRRLSGFSRLYAMLFCPDFAPDGRRNSYADRYLRHCLPNLAGVYFDNSTYIDEVAEQFAIPSELRSRLVVLHQPVQRPARLAPRDRSSHEPLRVLWAGRLTMQKNVDLLIRIARDAKDMEFHVWGRGNSELQAALQGVSGEPGSNLSFHGAFERFEALPLGNYDAFLYTSRWDGIPNVLLEAGAAGLPIVATRVGGISELVDEHTGWLLDEQEDSVPYAAALREIASRPDDTRMRVAAMDRRLRENHDWERYRDVLGAQPLSTGGILNASPSDHGDFQRASRGDACEALA